MHVLFFFISFYNFLLTISFYSKFYLSQLRSLEISQDVEDFSQSPPPIYIYIWEVQELLALVVASDGGLSWVVASHRNSKDSNIKSHDKSSLGLASKGWCYRVQYCTYLLRFNLRITYCKPSYIKTFMYCTLSNPV